MWSASTICSVSRYLPDWASIQRRACNLPCSLLTRIAPQSGKAAMSGALKSTLIFLPKAGSGKENNVFCCPTELFVVFLHIEAVCINLILNTLKLILFLELHKKYNFFFC